MLLETPGKQGWGVGRKVKEGEKTGERVSAVRVDGRAACRAVTTTSELLTADSEGYR